MNQDPTVINTSGKGLAHGMMIQVTGMLQVSKILRRVWNQFIHDGGKARLLSGFFDDNRVLMCTMYP